ncbi:scn4aa [Symbiodinium pilosum]|uniref:Scn4aa protein n=1 Tax=Symbiodinium pilosum TaxID=2952 RepID=A0A812RT54_SYMPI|nr:scn4aa [Symbiodinium pilosum]
MLTQREILMDELESQASMRRMMSEFVPAGECEWRKPNMLQSVSRHIIFKILVMVAILANSVYLGFDADLQVRNSYRRIRNQEIVSILPVADIVFPAVFVVELVIRLGAERWNFFDGEEKWWNIFDIVLVLNSGLETFWPFANFSFLRILRVFRLVRLVRVVRNVKSLKSLRTMIFALINSFVSLLWAFAMICLIIFVFSILFCNGVAAHNNSIEVGQNSTASGDLEAIEEALLAIDYFGGLWATCISLFSAVTGGNDWMMYGEMLRRLRSDESDITGELYFMVFGFYVAFCMIGLLNVVTGIFVDSAVSTRTEDEVVDAFTDQMASRCREVRRIFNEADTERKGALTYEQLKDQLSNPWVKAYFHGLDIDPNEAAIIFTLMDTDHNGTVTADEFIDGTMKLKGSAKSVDMLLLMFDQVRFSAKFNFLCSFIEDELRSIKSVLTPGGVSKSSPAKIFKAPDTLGSKLDCSLELLPEDDAQRFVADDLNLLTAVWLLMAVQVSTASAISDEETGVNLGIAVMLLGSIGFMMGIFYLVNHEDKEMQICTWKVICATISIFVSVLIYQAVNDAVKAMFLEGSSTVSAMEVAFAHSIVWFVILQVFLATVSGAVIWPWSGKLDRSEAGDNKRKLDLKCWAVILGHITGFAFISAWAQLHEQLDGSLAIFPIAYCVLRLFFKLTEKAREVVIYADDGKKDVLEEDWDEATEETEDDVMGLTMSFLLVQTIRLWATGSLPNEEGKMPKGSHTSDLQAALFMIVGILIAFASYVRTVYFPNYHGRNAVWLRLICDFSFSWTIMFGIDAFLTNAGLGGTAFGVVGDVITACIVTVWAFAVIYFLDKEADMTKHSMEALGASPNRRDQEKAKLQKRKRAAMRGTILALGVLIGFAWEKSFDTAVDDTAEKESKIMPPSFIKVVLAMLLATVVLPAWRWYILPEVVRLGGFSDPMDEEAEDAVEKAEEGYNPPMLPEDLDMRLQAAGCERAAEEDRAVGAGEGSAFTRFENLPGCFEVALNHEAEVDELEGELPPRAILDVVLGQSLTSRSSSCFAILNRFMLTSTIMSGSRVSLVPMAGLDLVGEDEEDEDVASGAMEEAIFVQALAVPLIREPAPAPSSFVKALCSEYPWLCGNPLECRTSQGEVPTPEEMKQELKQLYYQVVKTPGKPNINSWCFTSPSYWDLVVKECLAKGDSMASARAQFRYSVLMHPLDEMDASYCFLAGHCQNEEVSAQTTAKQGIEICNRRYPEPGGWQSVGFRDIPNTTLDFNPRTVDTYTHFNTTEQAVPYAKLACAQGNYHCDIVYCKETYCKTEYYRKKYQHLSPSPP